MSIISIKMAQMLISTFRKRKFRKLTIMKADIADRSIWEFGRAQRCCFVFLNTTQPLSEVFCRFGAHFGQI